MSLAIVRGKEGVGQYTSILIFERYPEHLTDTHCSDCDDCNRSLDEVSWIGLTPHRQKWKTARFLTTHFGAQNIKDLCSDRGSFAATRR